MMRIGLIGTESTHARLFAQRIATRADACVSCVLEDGDGTGAELGRNLGLPVVYSLEEALNQTDAVMIFYRRRDKHYEIARIALEHNKSVWLDKPFTRTVCQVQELFDLASKRHLALSGGSTLRFVENVRCFGARFRECEEALAASFNYIGRADSSYDGIAFYGPHALSVLQTAFGPEVRTLSAFHQGKSLTVVARYDHTAVTMQLADCFEPVGEIYTTERIERYPLTGTDTFEKALEEWLNLCNQKETADYETLVAPVALLNTLEKTLKTGHEEAVELWRR